MLVWKPKQLTKRIASSGLCSIHLFWLVMIILSPAEFRDDQKCSRNWRFSCMAARKNRQWWYVLNVLYSFWKCLVFFFFLSCWLITWCASDISIFCWKCCVCYRHTQQGILRMNVLAVVDAQCYTLWDHSVFSSNPSCSPEQRCLSKHLYVPGVYSSKCR